MNEQSRKNKTLHNANCCVNRCSSRKNNNRTLHFHAFPKKDASTVHVTNAFGVLEKIDRRKAWTEVLLMGKPVTNSMRVCSLHFQESDYLARGAALISMNRPRLKATAVPSRNLPEIQHTRKLQEANDFQQKQRSSIADPIETIPKHKILRTPACLGQSAKTSAVSISRNMPFENAKNPNENIEHLPNTSNPAQTRENDVSLTLVHLPLMPSNPGNATTTPVVLIPQSSSDAPNDIYVQQVERSTSPLSSISTATAISGSHHSDMSQMSNSSTDTASETIRWIENTTRTNQPMPQTEFKCRTCLDPVLDKLERTSISMICFEDKTVREGLVQLLPEMKSTLADDHFVCAKCFLLLRNALKFMKRCLETERKITKDLQNNSDDAFEDLELITVEEDQEPTANLNPHTEISLNSDVGNYECETDNVISSDEGDQCDEEDDSRFEFDPNVEEEDYILNGITNLLRGCRGTTTSNNPKQSDLNNCVIRHLNFLSLEHAKVSDHDTIVSIKNLEPDFMVSLQREKVRLLQNCCKFDENIFKNKRILLLGGHTRTKCLLCEELFNTEAKMQDHMFEVHGLSKAHLMDTYRYQYNPGSSNTCEACGKNCGNEASKKSHLNTCYVFPCPYCDELFNTAMLRNHTKEVHNDSRPFKCFRCKQETTNYTDYQSHSCSPLICEICGADFVDKNSFRLHSNWCEKKDDATKKCPECKERFSLSEFSNHVKTHQFPCTFCGRIFHNRKVVYKHEYYQHREKKKTLCPLCGKLVHILSRHWESHHENRMKNVKCTLCPKSFFQKYHLSMHVKLHHMFTRIVCERCGKYCNEYNIEDHYASEHPNDKVFKCAECEATFTQIAFLKQHAKSHAPETRKRRNKSNTNKSNKPRRPRSDESFVRKYKFRIKEPDAPITCKHCLKTIKGLTNYRIHLETHLTLLRHKCRYCDLTYSCYGNRRRHEKQHEDPKYKFRCGECWKIMDNQHELDAHMARHAAKPKKYQCEECSQQFCREYQLRSHLINEHVREKDIEEARDELLKDALMEFAVE